MKLNIRFLFLMVVSLVVYVGGPNGFTVWNAFPVVLAYYFLSRGLRSGRAAAFGSIAFAATALLLVTLFHLAWIFDWGRTATGSSTSALAFIFLPLWVLFFAGIIGAVGWGIGFIRE